MTVTIETHGSTRVITISRPEARNAVNPETAIALRDAFIAFDEDDTASVAILQGEGGAFCAGFDLKFASTQDDGTTISDIDIPDDWAGGSAKDIPPGPLGPSRLHLDKPVIGAIEGPAVAGGMELALWCDIRVMGKSAFMGVFCRRWGVPLIDGGTVRLPRIVGRGRALDLVLTGRKVLADECERIGLCERVVPDGSALETALELASEIARFPQACMRADRRSVFAQEGLGEADALKSEWRSASVFTEEGVSGAGRFASGAGRSGDFKNI